MKEYLVIYAVYPGLRIRVEAENAEEARKIADEDEAHKILGNLDFETEFDCVEEVEDE